MAAEYPYHGSYMAELASERSFRHSPWTSSPILSAVVFISLGTILVFFMQAQSITRKLRPSASGGPPRLPTTVVWGLFSLQHYQVRAQGGNIPAVVLDKRLVPLSHSSQNFSPISLCAHEQSIGLSKQFFCSNETNQQETTASMILGQVDGLRWSEQIARKNEALTAKGSIRSQLAQQATVANTYCGHGPAVLSGEYCPTGYLARNRVGDNIYSSGCSSHIQLPGGFSLEEQHTFQIKNVFQESTFHTENTC